MNIDSIKKGIVIDHISAGKGMRLYELLGLSELDASVAIIKNAQSSKLSKKDIIKIDADIKIDLDVIGYVAPDATVNIIKDGRLAEKFSVKAPKLLKNVIRCKNPRCITSTEQGLDRVFRLTDEQKKTYRCIYCDAKYGSSD